MSLSTVLFFFLAHLGVGIAWSLVFVSREAGVKFFRFNAGLAAILVAFALAFRVAALDGTPVESPLAQLAVNTLSFARVGAFALAHAGLSSAIVVLAGAAGHPLAAFVILLAGNVVMIALEALVVSVQTTRLVLFEFFIRFLHGEGRPFRPLPQPPSPS